MGWRRWLIVAGAGAVLMVVTVLFWRTGLERSDQWASVLGFFVGTLSLTLGLVQAARGARQPETATARFAGNNNVIGDQNVLGNNNTVINGDATLHSKNRYYRRPRRHGKR